MTGLMVSTKTSAINDRAAGVRHISTYNFCKFKAAVRFDINKDRFTPKEIVGKSPKNATIVKPDIEPALTIATNRQRANMLEAFSGDWYGITVVFFQIRI